MSDNENKIDKLINDGYEYRKCSFSKSQLYIIGFLLPLPFVILAGGIFRVFLSEKAAMADLSGPLFSIKLALILILSIIIHELIHGVVWRVGCSKKRDSIKITWNFIMPLCHCKEMLSKSQYLYGTLAPFFILAGGGMIAMMVYPSTYTLIFLLINIMLAGGDLLISLQLLKCGSGMILDLPSEAGFLIVQRRDH